MKLTRKLRLKVIERKLKWLYKCQKNISPFNDDYYYYKQIEYWETYKRGLQKGKKLEWVIDEYDGLPYLEVTDE